MICPLAGNVTLASAQSPPIINTQTKVTSFYNRGVAKQDQGDYRGAISDYNQAIKDNPNDADAYYNRGAAYKQLGDNRQARADLSKAAQLYQEQGNTKDLQAVESLLKKINP